MGFVPFSLLTVIISLNSVNQLIFVMVKCGVLFEVRTEFLYTIYKSFGFKGLIHLHQKPRCGRYTHTRESSAQPTEHHLHFSFCLKHYTDTNTICWPSVD
jgi:hypothetical protein